MAAFKDGTQVARTDIQIIVGEGGAAIPEPASFAIWGLLAVIGMAVTGRRR